MCLEPFWGSPRLETEAWLRGGIATILSHCKLPRSTSAGIACYELLVSGKWLPHWGLWIPGHV